MSKFPPATVLAALLLNPGLSLAEQAGHAPPRPDLAAMDANRDGKVTVKEFDAFMAAGPQNHAQGDKRRGPDPAKNGGAPPGPPPMEKQGQNPPPSGPGKHNPPRPPSGSEIDRNHDGLISKAEFEGFLASMPKPPSR